MSRNGQFLAMAVAFIGMVVAVGHAETGVVSRLGASGVAPSTDTLRAEAEAVIQLQTEVNCLRAAIASQRVEVVKADPSLTALQAEIDELARSLGGKQRDLEQRLLKNDGLAALSVRYARTKMLMDEAMGFLVLKPTVNSSATNSTSPQAATGRE